MEVCNEMKALPLSGGVLEQKLIHILFLNTVQSAKAEFNSKLQKKAERKK